MLHFRKAQEVGDAQQKQKVLIKIYQTLCYLNRSEEGKDIQAYFGKLNPGESITLPPRASLLAYIPLLVEDDVEAAKEFMVKNNPDKAIELLLNSLDIEETSIAFRLLGELYLKKGNAFKAHEFLLKAYPDFQFEPKFLQYFIVSGLSSSKPEEASNAMEQLKKIDPNYPGFNKLQGYLNSYSTANKLSDFDLP